MRVRLSGWQRVGIVLSVTWAIGGGMWGAYIGFRDEGDQADKLNTINHTRNDLLQDNCLAKASTTWKWCSASASRALTLCGHPTSDPDCSIAYNGSVLCDKKNNEAKQACNAECWARNKVDAGVRPNYRDD
jgi:hypothetical protein